jgi:catechol 2,3-dioxygenase-like lactoylglutathione lyase family enzyme
VRIHHVQLAAPPGCEEQAREFYGGLLGLTELPKPRVLRVRGGVWFALDAGQQLHIGVEEDFRPARKGHPGLSVGPQELDALTARLTQAGATVRWDRTIVPQRRAYVTDPWGNRLELLAGAP